MPLTPEIRQKVDQIRDYLYGGGYPDPMNNAEQLAFLFYFYLSEGQDRESISRARITKQKYISVYDGDWQLKNPLNASREGQKTIPKDQLRWSIWARALSGENLVRFLRDEVFAFHLDIAGNGAVNFMDGARLGIDDPTVLTQIVNLVDELRLDQADADTKGDLFEHVLKQISQAGELDGKKIKRGHGDQLSTAKWDILGNRTFYGNDVDPKMVHLATMNLTLRGLPFVRIRRRNVLTTTLDVQQKDELGLPQEGYAVVLANPPFSGRIDKDRIVDDVKVGTTTATEILFVKYMLDSLKEGGRCGVIVPEGVLFGSTGAHKELRRQLLENNTVEAVLSLPGGVFQPYSGVKTSVLVFRKGGSTKQVLFLHADSDGYKLDAKHDTAIEQDDLPSLVVAYQQRVANWSTWQELKEDQERTEKWWFATADEIKANDFNLSAGRYRPLTQTQVEHRDPRELLDELAAIETEIMEEIETLKESLQGEVV